MEFIVKGMHLITTDGLGAWEDSRKIAEHQEEQQEPPNFPTKSQFRGQDTYHKGMALDTKCGNKISKKHKKKSKKLMG